MSECKIATLTTHYVNNYGALLQTYALLHAITKQTGKPAETIGYYPKSFLDSWGMFYREPTLRNIARNICLILNPNILIAKKTRANANKDFARRYIKRSDVVCHNSDALREASKEYTHVICGSDQVWNNTLFPETTFFLDFIPQGSATKKIAYATSICEPFSPTLKQRISSCLSSFDFISLREESDIDKLKEITNKDITVQPDPVLLVDVEHWNSLSVDPRENSPYVLCCFIGGERRAAPIVNTISEKLQFKVLDIPLGFQTFLKHASYPKGIGVLEFLGLVKNASVVLTNSFHCTLLSILFERPFFVMSQDNRRKGRLDQAIERYCADNRILTSKTVNDLSKESILSAPLIRKDVIEADRQKGLSFLTNAIV